MKTVALINPSSSGHHQAFLRFFAQTLCELGYNVVAFTPEPGGLTTWIARTGPALSDRVRAVELRYARKHRVPGVLSIFFDKLAWVRFVARVVKMANIKPDLVFHTWLDNCLTPGLTAQLTDLVFPFRWTGLYFHPWYLRRGMKYARLRRGPLSTHHALYSHNCPAVAVLDEGVADKLQGLLGKKPVIVFPDIADDSPPDPSFPLAQQIREKANGRKIIGLVGVLSRRKGMLMLIEVARQAMQEDWYFVFAGELAEDSFLPDERQMIVELARSQPTNCLFHFQRIPDEPQFNAVVKECDVLFAVYQNFMSSSNLLTKAAIFEKPLIVSDAFCMGERVRKFGLGVTIDENSVPQCIEAVRLLCSQIEPDGHLPTARFAEFRRLHSIEQLRASFSALLTAAGL